MSDQNIFAIDNGISLKYDGSLCDTIQKFCAVGSLMTGAALSTNQLDDERANTAREFPDRCTALLQKCAIEVPEGRVRATFRADLGVVGPDDLVARFLFQAFETSWSAPPIDVDPSASSGGAPPQLRRRSREKHASASPRSDS